MRLNANSPKTLPFRGSFINKAGAGHAAGSTSYFNHNTGQTLDLFHAQVLQVGPVFALTAVVNNEALGKVRVDHHLLNGSGPAQLGDELIIGPLEFLPAGPRAQAAWRTRLDGHQRQQPNHCASPKRCRGVVTRVAPTGNFGQITETPDGRPFFVHHSQLQAGAMLRIGFPLSFLPAKTPRGWSALAVRRG
jgi:cold shock CspA family protein